MGPLVAAARRLAKWGLATWRAVVRVLRWPNANAAAATFWLSAFVAVGATYSFFIANNVSVSIDGGFTSFQGLRMPDQRTRERAAPVRLRVLFSNRGLLSTSITRLAFKIVDHDGKVHEVAYHDGLPVAVPGRTSVAKEIDLWVSTVQNITVTARDIDGKAHEASLANEMIVLSIVTPRQPPTIEPELSGSHSRGGR